MCRYWYPFTVPKYGAEVVSVCVCVSLKRFKFFSFYDLNPKEDPVRINLIYEQVRFLINFVSIVKLICKIID